MLNAKKLPSPPTTPPQPKAGAHFTAPNIKAWYDFHKHELQNRYVTGNGRTSDSPFRSIDTNVPRSRFLGTDCPCLAVRQTLGLPEIPCLLEGASVIDRRGPCAHEWDCNHLSAKEKATCAQLRKHMKQYLYPTKLGVEVDNTKLNLTAAALGRTSYHNDHIGIYRKFNATTGQFDFDAIGNADDQYKLAGYYQYHANMVRDYLKRFWGWHNILEKPAIKAALDQDIKLGHWPPRYAHQKYFEPNNIDNCRLAFYCKTAVLVDAIEQGYRSIPNEAIKNGDEFQFVPHALHLLEDNDGIEGEDILYIALPSASLYPDIVNNSSLYRLLRYRTECFDQYACPDIYVARIAWQHGLGHTYTWWPDRAVSPDHPRNIQLRAKFGDVYTFYYNNTQHSIRPHANIVYHDGKKHVDTPGPANAIYAIPVHSSHRHRIRSLVKRLTERAKVRWPTPDWPTTDRLTLYNNIIKKSVSRHDREYQRDIGSFFEHDDLWQVPPVFRWALKQASHIPDVRLYMCDPQTYLEVRFLAYFDRYATLSGLKQKRIANRDCVDRQINDMIGIYKYLIAHPDERQLMDFQGNWVNPTSWRKQQQGTYYTQGVLEEAICWLERELLKADSERLAAGKISVDEFDMDRYTLANHSGDGKSSAYMTTAFDDENRQNRVLVRPLHRHCLDNEEGRMGYYRNLMDNGDRLCPVIHPGSVKDNVPAAFVGANCAGRGIGARQIYSLVQTEEGVEEDEDQQWTLCQNRTVLSSSDLSKHDLALHDGGELTVALYKAFSGAQEGHLDLQAPISTELCGEAPDNITDWRSYFTNSAGHCPANHEQFLLQYVLDPKKEHNFIRARCLFYEPDHCLEGAFYIDYMIKLMDYLEVSPAISDTNLLRSLGFGPIQYVEFKDGDINKYRMVEGLNVAGGLVVGGGQTAIVPRSTDFIEHYIQFWRDHRNIEMADFARNTSTRTMGTHMPSTPFTYHPTHPDVDVSTPEHIVEMINEISNDQTCPNLRKRKHQNKTRFGVSVQFTPEPAPKRRRLPNVMVQRQRRLEKELEEEEEDEKEKEIEEARQMLKRLYPDNRGGIGLTELFCDEEWEEEEGEGENDVSPPEN